MGELIGRETTADFDEETGIDELVETGADLVGSHFGGKGEHPELDTLTGNRGQLQRSARPPGETGHSGGDDIPDAVWRTHSSDISANDPPIVLAGNDTLLDQMAEQLAEEEDVSRTAIAGNCGETTEIPVELLTEGAGDELLNTGRVEATQA